MNGFGRRPREGIAEEQAPPVPCGAGTAAAEAGYGTSKTALVAGVDGGGGDYRNRIEVILVGRDQFVVICGQHARGLNDSAQFLEQLPANCALGETCNHFGRTADEVCTAHFL